MSDQNKVPEKSGARSVPTPKDVRQERVTTTRTVTTTTAPADEAASKPAPAVAARPAPVKARQSAPKSTDPTTGRHRITTKEFVEMEYNSFKNETQKRLTDAEGLLRVVAARTVGSAATMAHLASLQREFATIKEQLERLDADPSDDPVVAGVKGEKRRSLNERLEGFYRSLSSDYERVTTEQGLHARAIDYMNVQLGEHTTQLADHETMLLDHDKTLDGIAPPTSTAAVALIAAGVGLVLGFIAFWIKLWIVVPNTTKTEEIRGVTVKTVHDYHLVNGFWPALLVGILVFCIAFFVIALVGFLATNGSSSTRGKETRTRRTTYQRRSWFRRRDKRPQNPNPAPAVTTGAKPREMVVVHRVDASGHGYDELVPADSIHQDGTAWLDTQFNKKETVPA